MPEQNSQPDARDSVIYANSLFMVKPHRKIVSPDSFITVLRNDDFSSVYPTFIDLIENDGGQNLKTLFDAVAGGAGVHGESSRIFWLINVTDDRVTETNNTHSTGSYPHAHVIYGPLPDNHKYGYVLQEKTYTPAPHPEFQANLQDLIFTKSMNLPDEDGTMFIHVLPDEIKESSAHLCILSPNFLNFRDFAARAEKGDYITLNALLTGALKTFIPSGGARLICDDFNNPGIFTLRIQAGDQEHKWFERPQPAL